MNRRGVAIVNILSVFILVMGFCLPTNIARGDYVEKEMPTQINEQTDLFKNSIDDLPAFEGKLRADKGMAIDSLGQEGESPEGLSFITKKSKSQLQAESSKLEAIDVHDLGSMGRDEMIKNDMINELYIDYSRPLNREYMEDAAAIAGAQEELQNNLFGELKKLGVDCKTVKGDERIEPEYYLQTRKTQHMDTVYNKAICEELRNQYNCVDSLLLTCKRRGMKWEEWEERDIELSGPWIHWNRRWWTYAIKWKKERFGIHLHPAGARPDVAASIREHIMEKLGISDEQIHKEVNVFARGEGAINHIEGKGYIWDTFRIGYKYRDGKEICSEWSEDWSERCNLSPVSKPFIPESKRKGKRGV